MSKSLPAFTQDNQYPFSYLRMGQLGYNSPGVVLAGDMQVSPGTGLQVQISAGEAYVQQTVARLGSFYAQRGVYQIFDDSVDNPYNTITAPVTYPRVDQVIARVYDSYEQQLSGSSYWRYEWLPGTETSGASLTNLNGAATLPDNSLLLAYCLATTSMSSWSSSNINNIFGNGTVIAGPWYQSTLASNIAGFALARWEGGGDGGRNLRVAGDLTNNTGGTTSATVATLPIPFGAGYTYHVASSSSGQYVMTITSGVSGGLISIDLFPNAATVFFDTTILVNRATARIGYFNIYA